MNLEDIKKLTVADLKKELKARNLPVSGVKTELLQRLSENISSNYEHQILDQSGRVDESLLEGVHEDEVLGISTGAASTVVNPPAPPKKPVLKKETSVPISKSAAETSNNVAEGTMESSTGKEPEAKKIRLKPSVSSEGDVTPKPETKVSLASLDPEQAKIERAKKFNVPLSDLDRKKLRADRFGTGGASKGSAASVSGNKSAADPSILEKRAERFGTSVAKKMTSTETGNGEGNEKLKQRADRFGLENKTQGSNGVGDKEKLMKRQMRFASGSAGDEGNEKKKARAERFGTGSK